MRGWSTSSGRRSWSYSCGRRLRLQIWWHGRKEATPAVAELKDDESLDWSDDGPYVEEQAAQQKAVLESFESLKKVEDNAHAREEDSEERWRRAVDLSIEADRRFSAEHRERLREDREGRRTTYEKLGFSGAGPSNGLPRGQ
jgi:hypothetical protein